MAKLNRVSLAVAAANLYLSNVRALLSSARLTQEELETIASFKLAFSLPTPKLANGKAGKPVSVKIDSDFILFEAESASIADRKALTNALLCSQVVKANAALYKGEANLAKLRLVLAQRGIL
jgi:hypothetical protein